MADDDVIIHVRLGKHAPPEGVMSLAEFSAKYLSPAAMDLGRRLKRERREAKRKGKKQ